MATEPQLSGIAAWQAWLRKHRAEQDRTVRRKESAA